MQESDWKIHWSKHLNIGVPVIDEEHRRFIERVNDLNGAIVGGEGKARIERLLDLMIMEASRHFWDEQRLLAEWNYPGAADHAAKHGELLQHFARIMDDFQQAEVSFTWLAKGLRIKQLLIDHLLREDMKFRDFLQQRDAPTKPKKSVSRRSKRQSS